MDRALCGRNKQTEPRKSGRNVSRYEVDRKEIPSGPITNLKAEIRSRAPFRGEAQAKHLA